MFNHLGTASERKNEVMAIASWEATKYGLGTVAAVGAGTALLAYTNKNFNKFASVSIKLSIPLMAGLGVWSFRFENVQHQAQYYPERWGLKKLDGSISYDAAPKPVKSLMPMHHKVLNYLYDRPFHMVAGLGVPFAGFVLHKNLKMTHLTLSQKIMHSRVFAQAGVLSILLSVMAFRGYMDKRGRFPDPNQVAVKEDEKE